MFQFKSIWCFAVNGVQQCNCWRHHLTLYNNNNNNNNNNNSNSNDSNNNNYFNNNYNSNNKSNYKILFTINFALKILFIQSTIYNSFRLKNHLVSIKKLFE